MEEFDPAWFDLDPADVVAFESSSTQDLTQPCQSGSGTKSAALYLSEQIETPDAIGEGEDPVTNVYGSNISSLCSPNPQPRNVFGSPKISIDEYRSTEERRFSSLKCGTSHPARPTVSLKPKGLHSAWQHISAPAGPDAPSNAPPPNVPNSSKSGSSDDTTKGRTMIASRPIRPLASRLKLADWGLPKGTVDAYWQKGVKEVYPWQCLVWGWLASGCRIRVCRARPEPGFLRSDKRWKESRGRRFTYPFGPPLLNLKLINNKDGFSRRQLLRQTEPARSRVLVVMPFLSMVSEKTKHLTDILRKPPLRCAVKVRPVATSSLPHFTSSDSLIIVEPCETFPTRTTD
eukprot:1180197-Prorocentrum_minimum.AAC.6